MSTPSGPAFVLPNQTVFYTSSTPGTWSISDITPPGVPGGNIISGQGSNLIIVMWGAITGSCSILCDSDTDALEISIDTVPTFPISPSSETVCGSKVYSIPGGLTPFQWNVLGGAFVPPDDPGTESSVVVNWTTPGTGIIQVSYSNGSETACSSIVVNIQSPPSVPTISGPTTVVKSTSSDYSTPDIGSGAIYSWSSEPSDSSVSPSGN